MSVNTHLMHLENSQIQAFTCFFSRRWDNFRFTSPLFNPIEIRLSSVGLIEVFSLFSVIELLMEKLKLTF